MVREGEALFSLRRGLPGPGASFRMRIHTQPARPCNSVPNWRARGGQGEAERRRRRSEKRKVQTRLDGRGARDSRVAKRFSEGAVHAWGGADLLPDSRPGMPNSVAMPWWAREGRWRPNSHRSRAPKNERYPIVGGVYPRRERVLVLSSLVLNSPRPEAGAPPRDGQRGAQPARRGRRGRRRGGQPLGWRGEREAEERRKASEARRV